MISRFKIIWGESDPLKYSWINFLGMFIYYLHGIDVHNHIYYNKKYDYCYILRDNGLIHQHPGIATSEVRLSDIQRHDTSHSMSNDKCVMCNHTRSFP